ncbi:hypothetical protein Pla108_00630 [Botrimarina colliarenosi]|uniref:DUF3352 domain-containing protein n=1 Tax=Botrimarina colliarenosi TaxID=2528001 RepID=A0A5C6AI89_9BACT|nr:hypothetical protein [Botrimarina colliarenosi]TWT99130.1 hypothetical protein Pla108_00630 [Botrimarina colliarenosi]
MPVVLLRRVTSVVFAGLLLAFAPAADAAPNASQAFPAETVGFVAADNAVDLADRWSRTQVGRLADDPTMRPFVDQVQRRLNNQFGALEQRLGVTIEDFRAAATGEAAIGVVKSTSKKQPGRVVALIDVTGREAEAKALLSKIDKRLVERGAAKSQSGDVTIYQLPEDKKAKLPTRTAAVFHQAGRLGAAEGEQLAVDLLARVRGEKVGRVLADVDSFQQTQARARKAAGRTTTSIAWYVSPFEYEAATREPPAPGDLPDKKGTLTILAEQGFDAITGVGGLVSVATTPERDFVHHTFIYAPPKHGSANKPAAQKYDLGMRMLELPNGVERLSAENPPVEMWAPRQVATYKTVHIDVANVFEHLPTTFDALNGYEGAFHNILAGLEKDPYGPKIDVKKDVIPHLGTRAVVMTDYTLPITPECERYLFVIDVDNEAALREPIDRWLKSDGAERKELDGVPYWEMVPEDEALAHDDLDPLVPLGEPVGTARGEREERVLRRAAVCLHKGRLAIGSDADFLRQALFGVSTGETLSASPDMRATIGALADIAPGERCVWTFTRNDEAFRPTYELVREGKMPSAQTFFGRLLNRMMTTEEEREVGELREQKINGQRLPSFELARRYFGPSARSVRSEGDGWVVSGVLLSKAPGTDSAAVSVARNSR